MVFKKVARAFFIALLIFLGAHSSISRVSATENSEVVHSDMFEFEAYIKDTDIIDGTAPFDSNDEPGNDSGNKNGVVRTFDTVTYPMKITINPKKSSSLKNIRIRISGTLDNGVTEDRINARYAVGGFESVTDKKVSFEQNYVINQTGNAVMIPITIEVLGAKHGTVMKPNFKVEVLSVDGKDIPKGSAIAEFNNLPSFETSAKVNIKPYVRKGLTDGDFPYLPHSKMIPDGSEYTGVQEFSLSWGLDRLPGKSDIRGATFPDSDGDINYTIEMYGEVYWDNLPEKRGTEVFNFNGRDTDFMIFDHRPVTTVRTSIGAENTLMEGKSYTFSQTNMSNTARSSMANYNQNTVKARDFDSVWDSGEWNISKPTKTSRKIIYEGNNTDYMIGSTFPTHRTSLGESRGRTFGVNDKLFSTHSFLVDVQNEYRIGGINNPNDWTNNVIYRVRVVLDDYTDVEGNVTPFNKSATTSMTIRNGTGGMSVRGTYMTYPSRGYTSPKQPYNWETSTGDGSILTGEDVYWTPRVLPTSHLYGGYTAYYRWNTDAFELTEPYAKIAETNIFNRGYRNLSFDWVTNDKKNQIVKYGVATFNDNSFESFTSKGGDDYEWYDTYAEAKSNGIVGAMMTDISAPVGGIKSSSTYIPLRVKHENIGFGSVTKDDTPIIAVINADAYLDENRNRKIDVTGNRSYNNYSEWDQNGNLLRIQRPTGGGTNFDTLAVVPAKTSTAIKSNKSTYYNSEIINWTVTNSIVLPEHGVPENIDSGVTIKNSLPKGLEYVIGSGKVDGRSVDPVVVTNDNGTKELIWDVLISNGSNKIPKITFDTSINPFALTSGVQSSLEVNSIIESELDGGPIDSRTSSQSVTILKVGMVGIHESIDIDNGAKNSLITIRMRPYTTIEDEYDVMGLTNMPKTGDRFGSVFQGTAELVEVGVDANRPVSIYLNNQYIESNKPHEIDYTKDGWYKYTGKEDISKAQSLLFHVEGVMKNTDDIEIAFQVQTKDNDFGDRYHYETVVNSATNYRLSPISNRVRHTIRADVEFNIERIQIYTANAKEGLPVRVRVNKVINRDRSNNERLKLVLYEYDEELKSYSKAVYEKEFTVASLEQENALSIPSQYLSPNTNRSYEARIEGYNTDRLYVLEGADRINTLGYTATETEIDYEMTSPKALTFEGVVMTERRLGFDIDTLYERIRLPMSPLDSVESGDGIEINQKLQYKNDVGFSNYTSPEFAAVLDERIFNGSYGEKLEDGTVRIHLEQGGQENSAGEMIDTYRPPHVYVEGEKGTIYSDEQYAAVMDTLDRAVVSGGNKVYVPVEVDVWGDELGQYPYRLESVTPIGVNEVRVVVRSSVEVTRLDIDSPVGEITARFDRSERDDHVGYTSNDLVDMIDSNRVTVDVTGVEDVGVSGVDFVTIEEQKRIGYDGEWMTVREIEYDWPDPYNTRSQTYDFDVSHAQDTRFVLTLTDRAGNTSNRIASNVVRQSVLQAVDFRITNVVNPQLTEDELDAIRASDFEGVVELTAGTDVTFDVTYQLRHLDTVDELSGKITIKTISDDRTHTHEIEVNEDETGHHQNVTFTKTFTVPQGTPKGSEIAIVGNLEAKLANGTTHKISYPSTADKGVIDNHIEEFFRFRIVR